MVVIRTRAAAESFTLGKFAEVPVEFIEFVMRATRTREVFAKFRRWIEEAVHRKSIKCVRDGFALADD